MKHFPRRQKGAVLALGLIFLAVASIVSIASMRASSVQEKITSNQRNKTISLMAAEYGASQLLQALTARQALPSPNTDAAISGLGAGDAKWSYTGNGTIYTITGRVRHGSAELAQTSIELIINSPGGNGIRAGNNVTFNSDDLYLTGGEGDIYAEEKVIRDSKKGVLSITPSGLNTNVVHYTGGVVGLAGLEVGVQENPNPWDSIDLVDFPKSWPSTLPDGWTSCSNLNDPNYTPKMGEKFYCTNAMNFNNDVKLNGVTIVVNGTLDFRRAAALEGARVYVRDNINVEGVFASSGDVKLYAGARLDEPGNIELKYTGDSEQKISGELYAGGSKAPNARPGNIRVHANKKTTLMGSMGTTGNIQIDSKRFDFISSGRGVGLIKSWREL